MMSCRDIHERISRGEDPDSAEERAHVATCEACQDLLADDASLRRILTDLQPVDPGDELEAVRARIDAESGPVAVLRSLPTFVRMASAVGLAVMLAVAVVLLSPRPDLSLYPADRMVLALGLMGLCVVASIAVVLRPLHRPAPPTTLLVALLLLALVVPVVLGVLPRAHTLHPASLRGEGPELARFALQCLAFGSITGAPVLVALWLLDRGAHAALQRALVAATIAGLAGNVTLHLHCPITAPTHLLVGHANVGVLLLLIYGILRVRVRRKNR